MRVDRPEHSERPSGAALEVRVLGPFEVLVGGTRVDAGGPKRSEVVALLALHAGRVVTVDTLAEALWGARRPRNARNALQHHVARLRKVLGATSIVSASNGYALAGGVVDALVFAERLDTARAALRSAMPRRAVEAVDEALRLWRGPALAGFLDSAWAGSEAIRLEALRVDALEDRFDAALALGHHAEVLAEIRAAAAENPFRERLWGQLMLALYRSGRQAAALDAFREVRRALSEKLGLEPGPELRRLQAAILAHDEAIGPVPPVHRRRGNLPAPVTSFVGRAALLVEVGRLMSDRRLVTLVGPPGSGKSRLALELARSVEPDCPDGAWLVELARARHATDVGRVVANALDASEPRSQPDAAARVLERLRDAVMLLVVDNCEHVLVEVAGLIASVLARCPGVRVLATSREALGLAGESRVAVAPLPLPDESHAMTGDPLGSDAVRLFAERARDVRPDFELTAETARVVAQICRRLDGLPLAIELAAARTGVLGLNELLRRLDHQFVLLTRGDRPAADDAYAVGKVIEWSYELLHQDERTLLCRLAVFRGGCSLPAAVAVAEPLGLGETAVTRLLSGLVDKSILRASFPDGEARYDLLETVRAYASAQLGGSGALSAARAAHAEFFAATATAAARELREREHLACLRRLELEHDNLWEALAYARDEGEAELAVELAAGLGWYFALANLHSEGRAFVETALAVPTDAAPTAARIAAHAELCHLADLELDRVAAIEAGQRGLALAEAVSAPREAARAKSALALALQNAGERRRAARLLAEARASCEALDDDWGLVGCELIAAIDAVASLDADAVATSAERILRRAGAIGYRPFVVWGMLLRGWSAERRGQDVVATNAYERALEVAHELDLPHFVAFALAQLGARACAEGDVIRAELLQRRGIATADRARVPWFAAHARVQLAATLAHTGEPDAAGALYRMVVDGSREAGVDHASETFFVALAGNPVAAALKGLAEPADRRDQPTARASGGRGQWSAPQESLPDRVPL